MALTHEQDEALVALKARGYVEPPRQEEHPPEGGPIRLVAPDGKSWLLMPDGTLKEE